MYEFKEYSHGFDAFEKIAAKFQENPLEFKQQFTSNPKQADITKVLGGRHGKIGKLFDEYLELAKQEDKHDEIIRCMDSIIHLQEKYTITAGIDELGASVSENELKKLKIIEPLGKRIAIALCQHYCHAEPPEKR